MSRIATIIRRRAPRHRQQGAVAIMVAFVIMLLLMLAALAVDSFHVFVVRNELQNDADAAALAGADHFFTGTPLPNAALAEEQADKAIAFNRTMHNLLTTGDVETGYWNAVSGFSSTQVAATDPLAVRVEVSQSNGNNGGPVELFLGNVLGIQSVPVFARAVAVSTPPGMVWPGQLFPMVMTQCMFDNFWDTANNRPLNDPATGQPYVFRVGSSYHYSSCESGQWTSFQLNRDDVPTIRMLLEEGNTEAIGVGDPTWIEPGTKTTLFGDVNDCSAVGDKSCEYVTIPVVATNDIDTHANVPVSAFSCVRIRRSEGGSNKYIEVQMATGCKADGEGGGTYYGSATPAKLSQ